MADEVDCVYKAFEINMSIDYGEWYVMRPMVLNGRMRAFVDDDEIYDSNSSFPVATYEEPPSCGQILRCRIRVRENCDYPITFCLG